MQYQVKCEDGSIADEYKTKFQLKTDIYSLPVNIANVRDKLLIDQKLFQFSARKNLLLLMPINLHSRPLGQRSISNTNYSDTGSARRVTFQCVINAMNTS